MRIPKGVKVSDFSRALEKLGYEIVRERGSHMTLLTQMNGKHVVRLPDHSPVAPGTMRSILSSVADHHGIDREAIVSWLGLNG